MKKFLLYICILLCSSFAFGQPRPKDVIEKGPILYPEGKWRWLGVNARLQVPNSTALPSTDLSEGDFYYDTVKDSMYFYTGSVWRAIEDRTRIKALLDSLTNHNVRISASALSNANEDTALSNHRTQISNNHVTDANQDTSLSNHRSGLSSIRLTNANQDTALSNHRTQISNNHVTDANQDTSLSNHRTAISSVKTSDAGKASLSSPNFSNGIGINLIATRRGQLDITDTGYFYGGYGYFYSGVYITANGGSLVGYNTSGYGRNMIQMDGSNYVTIGSTDGKIVGVRIYGGGSTAGITVWPGAKVSLNSTNVGASGEEITSIDTVHTSGGNQLGLKFTAAGQTYIVRSDTSHDTRQDTTNADLNSKVSTLRGYYGDALGSSGTWQGETIVLTAGETMIVGHVCYIKSDGKAWRADADSSATMPGMFIATAATAADAKGIFLAKGRFRLDTWNFSIGAILFVSTTKGLVADSAPSGTGDQLEGIGVALTTNEIMFTPYPILVEK